MSLPIAPLVLVDPGTWNILGALVSGLGALAALAGSLRIAHTYFAMPLLEFIQQAPRAGGFRLRRSTSKWRAPGIGIGHQVPTL